MSKLLGVFGPCGPRVDRVVVCKLVFALILYILCQQFGGCISVGEYIDIGFFCKQLGGMYNSGCLWALQAMGGECLPVGYMY